MKTTKTIVVEKPTKEKLTELQVFSWPIWEKEPAIFDWYYDEKETCYILEGDVCIQPKGGGPAVEFRAGDLVVFPSGLGCTWKIRQAVRKHYRFGE